MRCLVTGASGFLGSHLVRKLLERKHSVTVLLRPGSDQWRLRDCLSQIEIIYGSLESATDLATEVQKDTLDATFHLAWSGVTGEHRNSVDQVTKNVAHSLQLWQAVHKAGCKTFIGVGSQAEYGPYSGVLHENIPTAPETMYGASKLALGIMLKQLCVTVGMRFVWLRLFSVYGPTDDERHMVPSLIRSLMQQQKPTLTDEKQVWDYLYVTDVAAALCAAMETEAAGVFNLGSGQACILRDFITEVRDCIDPALPLGFGEVSYRHDQVVHLEANISRLKNATGWIPQVERQEGIRRTVDWYRNHLKTAQISSVGDTK